MAAGWGGIDIPEAAQGSDLLMRESVDHNAVLPRATVAVHHGGAGSAHAGARAGIPSVVVPFIADQPFWGHLLHQRGLGPEPIPYRQLTADRLAAALGEAGRYRGQAARTGELLRKEDGTAVALEVLEGLAAS